MALDLEVTTSLPSATKPSGHTPPATTNTFGGNERSEPFSYTVASSGISHASDDAAGLTALIAALTTWLTDTYIPSTLGLDVTGNTVTAIATLKSCVRENSGFSDSKDAAQFITGTDQYTANGTIIWEIS